MRVVDGDADDLIAGDIVRVSGGKAGQVRRHMDKRDAP
jgi:hypothetical protein